MMSGLILLAGLAQILFVAFLVWAVLAHVKEQRRQSHFLAKIAKLLEERGKG